METASLGLQCLWHQVGPRGLQARVGPEYDANVTYAHRVYWPGKNCITVERDVKFHHKK